MRCHKAEELLLTRADASSPDSELLVHLAGCAACRAQEEALTRALGALEAIPGPAPDLWLKFQSRLASEVECHAAREQMPAYAEGALSGAIALAMQAHLVSCAGCASEEEALARSLWTLERVVPAEAPDLWPALAARLAASQSAPKPAFRFPVWLCSGPAWRPGLALAGVALAAVALRGPLPMLTGGMRVAARPEVQAAPPQVPLPPAASSADDGPGKAPTVMASATRAHATEEATVAVILPRASGVRRQARGTRGRRLRLRTLRVTNHRRHEVTVPSRPASERGREMAATLPFPMPEETLTAAEQPAEMNSAEAQARIMPEAVQVGLMLARMESSVKQPFQEVGYHADER